MLPRSILPAQSSPPWEICLPCPWLVNTIFTLVPYLLFKSASAHYFPGDVLKFIGREVREPAVLLEIHGHALAAVLRAQDERVQCRTHLNLFKWECVFEALHGVSFVMVPSGSAVDSLSGFLKRGALAFALGLIHNHFVCFSDHSLRFFIPFFLIVTLTPTRGF